jgi:cytochrome c5
MMTRNFRYGVLVGCNAVLALAFASSMHVAAQVKPAATSSVPKQKTSSDPSEGERVFEQQCARCHATPDGFSPRISGTVMRHMRVRASLSKHEEEELLRFLNP